MADLTQFLCVLDFAVHYCLSNYDQIGELREDDIEHMGETNIPSEEDLRDACNAIEEYM